MFNTAIDNDELALYHAERLARAHKNQDQIRTEPLEQPVSMKIVDINKNKKVRDLKDQNPQNQTSFCLSFEQAHALALSWGLHEGNFIKARQRGRDDYWIAKQIHFVASRADVIRKGAYLAKILAYNNN